MDDPFGDAVDLEEVHIKEGFGEGVIEGTRLGYKEGQDLGILKGFEIVSELGYFRGSILAWRRMQEQLPQIVSPKAERAIKAMETALDDFPLLDPKDERLHSLLEDLRARHKAVNAMLRQQPAADQSADLVGTMDF